MAAPISLLLGSHVYVEVFSLQLLPQLLPELNDGSAHRVGLCKDPCLVTLVYLIPLLHFHTRTRVTVSNPLLEPMSS